MEATKEKQLIGAYAMGQDELYTLSAYGTTTAKPYIEVYSNLDTTKDFSTLLDFKIYVDIETSVEYRVIVELFNTPMLLKVTDADTGEVLFYKSLTSINFDRKYITDDGKYEFTRFTGTCSVKHRLNGTKNIKIETDAILTMRNCRDDNYYEEEDYYLVNTHDVELPIISRKTEILTATNFNDEENPSLTYSLPYQYNSESSKVTSLALALSFDGSTADIPYKAMPIEEVSYTRILTEAERQILRNKCANCTTKTIYYLVKTIVTDASGNTAEAITTTEKVLSIVGAMPSIIGTVEDINETTLALTGDKNVIVKYFSNAKYEINATASKGASINYQTITAGSKSSTAPEGVLIAVDSNKFVFTCSDTRDNLSSYTLIKGVVEYVRLTCNININAPDTEGKLNFTINGNYYNGSFGLVNNTLAVRYRYKTNSGNYGSWQVVTPTIKNNTYSVSVSMSGLNYQDTYTFQAEALDNLESVLSREYPAKTAPVFDWSETDFNFNVPIYYTENGRQYNITEAVKDISGADISSNMLTKMNGLVNAFTSRQNCIVEVYPGANYNDVFVSLQLIGNNLTGYVDAKRNSNAGAGDITNEVVCSVEFDIDKKVAGFNSCGFPSATIGALASFAVENCQIYQDDGSVSEDMVGKGSFNIYLTATDISASRYNGFFTMPCMLDLTKF